MGNDMARLPWLLALSTAFSIVGKPEGLLEAHSAEQDGGTEQCNADCRASRLSSAPPGSKVWNVTRQTTTNFEVAGVNLAWWFGGGDLPDAAVVAPNAEPFELYDDFNIEDLITGNESWYDLIRYRRFLQRPSLSFYIDKVSRKRWLPSVGFAQPHVYALSYAHELTESGKLEDEREAIVGLLPAEASYAAKPTHMAEAKGVWLVKHDTAKGVTRFSHTATQLTEDEEFSASDVAASLAEDLHTTAKGTAWDWAQERVLPGIVVEELFTATEHEDRPALEFAVFVIWGRVWIAQMCIVVDGDRWNDGFFHRNGTLVLDSGWEHEAIPSWIDWQRILDIAERLGEHKDMLRVDIFVGVPTHSPPVDRSASETERQAAAQYVVSESEIYPTTIFVDNEICEEGARLWIAGYKVGNYEVVPNIEVPTAFLDTGFCSPNACGSGD